MGRLRLREFFYNPDDTNDSEINPFKRKSKWMPPSNRESALENYTITIGGKSTAYWTEAPFTVPMITSPVKKGRLCCPYEEGLTLLLNQLTKARQQ